MNETSTKARTALLPIVVAAVVLTAAPAGAQTVTLNPTADGMPGAEVLQNIVNWGGQIALIFSLLALVAGGAMYGLGQMNGRTQGAHQGRQLAMGGAIGALITGVAPFVVNTLFASGVAGA